MDTSLNPRTQSEWARTARSEGLNPETVTPFDRKYGSASVLKFAEFLNLKVLWNRRPAQDFRIGDFVHEGPMTEANRIDLRELRNVVGTVKGEDPHPSNRLKDKSAPPPNGLFTTFHYFTHLVMRSQSRDHQASPKISHPRRNAPRIMPDNIITDLEKLHLGDTPRALDLRTSPRTPATQLGPGNEDFGTPFVGEVPPRTEYEATVNMGLITMLCAIRLHCSSLKDGHWLPDPKPFDLRDPTTRDSPAILQARVDGYLSKKGQFDTAFAIVEVKPYSRTLKRKKIEWQEAAQMAAWVSQTTGNRMGTLASPENVRRRFMISQDCEEIYITIAEYDKTYQDYISGPQIDPNTHNIRAVMQGHHPMSPTPMAPRNKGKGGIIQGGYGVDNRPSGLSHSPFSGTAPNTPVRPVYKDPPRFQLPTAASARGSTQSGRNTAQALRQSTSDVRKHDPSKSYVYPNPGFLAMTTYGPFLIGSGKDMEFLCRIIVALSMEVLSNPDPTRSL